ncbi:unnamed protein product [Meloidogyne enterolobii]|uniref:Uncharacterized protein n=1 Tax=Meloidogyne enterolobii TaxID=390850 RepID=A0ACB0YMY2_MELEN
MVKGTGSDPVQVNKFLFSLSFFWKSFHVISQSFFCFFFITTNKLYFHIPTQIHLFADSFPFSLWVSVNFFYFFKVGIFVYKIKGNQ